MSAVKHLGFAGAVAAAKAGGATNPAGAVASASRNASPAAKRKNPRLLKVKGKAKKARRSAIANMRAGY